jgi:hypothetical protein
MEKVMMVFAMIAILMVAGGTMLKKMSDGGEVNMEKWKALTPESTTNNVTDTLSKVAEDAQKNVSELTNVKTQPTPEAVEQQEVVMVDVEDITSTIIQKVETDFNWTTVISDDNGGLSIGSVQWHEERAGELLRLIYDKDSSLFSSLPHIVSRIESGDETFKGYIPDRVTRLSLQLILGKDDSIQIQKDLMLRDIKSYHVFLSRYKDDKARVFLADIVHQYGVVQAPSFFSQAGINHEDSLQEASDKWMSWTSKYRDRRVKVVAMIKQKFDNV